MNRMDEYKAMLEELEPIPNSNSVQKAFRRRNRKKAVVRTMGSLAAVLCLFVGSINLSPSVAAACKEIPFLAELTELLTFHPSLQEAVENDYIQLVGQEQTQNDITARIEHLIVDQKQVTIFYRLHSEVYHVLSATPDVLSVDGEPVRASISSGGLYEEDNELRDITIDFMEEDVPDTLNLTLSIHDNGIYETGIYETEPTSYAGQMEEELARPKPIAEMTFRLGFDPNFTEQGRTVTLDQNVVLDGQTITVTDMEIYPSHIRINIEEAEENTAWLKSLRFYLETEDGRRVEKISNGISATGTLDNPSMTSYRAESTYFYDADAIRLVITGADFLDKDKELVHINLKTLEHDELPEGVEIASAKKTSKGWILEMKIRATEENHTQLFSSLYTDLVGTEYDIHRYSCTMEWYDEETGESNPDWETETYFLDGFEEDEVMMKLLYSRTWNPETPVVVALQ